MQRELVLRAIDGDYEAFSSLVRTSSARQYAIATLILRDGDRAQDAVQEAFISAWKGLRALRDPDAWDAWLHRLVVRACYAAARRERRRTLIELHVLPDGEPAGAADAPTALAERDRLERHLGRLPIDQRAVIVLHFYVGLPLTEAADVLGIPHGTAKSRLHRGLSALRAHVGPGARGRPRHRPGAIGMNDLDRFERLLADTLREAAPTREPDRLVPEILRAARREHRRPRWLALTKEPPMRLSSRVAVGSPVVRTAYLAFLLLVLTALMAGAVAASMSLLAGPRTIVVDGAGNGDVLSVVEGVALAEDGDTVLVRPGTYPGSLLIEKDITLQGDGARASVVISVDADSKVPGWSVMGPVPYGIMVVDASVTLSDLMVVGPANTAAFVLVGGSTTIERVGLDLEPNSGFPQSGIALFNQAAATISDCDCSNTGVWEVQSMWATADGGLIAYPDVQGTGVLAIRGVRNEPGIRVTPADGSVIEGNTSAGAITIGEAGGTGSLTVSGNRAAAIDILDSGPALVVRGNDLVGGPRPDAGAAGESPWSIALRKGSATIEDNHVRGSRNGILLWPGVAATVRGNVIEDNDTGITTNMDSAPVIQGNAFCRNDRDLVAVGSTVTLDASNTICPPGTTPAPSAG